MTFQEKSLLLDELEIRLLQDGMIELSLALEQFENLHPDKRWREIACCLQEEDDLPESYALFQENDPQWDKAALLIGNPGKQT